MHEGKLATTPGAESETAPARPLEPDAEVMLRRLEAVVERVVQHVGSLPEQPSDGTAGAVALARERREPLPAQGTGFEALLAELFDVAVPASFNTAGPGYLAYIPGGGLFDAALGAFIAESVNRYVGVFAAAPVLSQLETNVVSWFAQIVGYPPTARGFLTSGGSLANFSAVVTARSERLGEQFLDGVVYTSDQAHHSVLKSALLAGFPRRNVRSLPTDDEFRMVPEAVADALAADRAAGLRPFMIVASAGTTNTGAVDPLPELAELAASENLWLHVDAAYGGFFALTQRGREALAGLERADSLVLDPHKSLFLPYGSGCVLVRDGEALRRAHAAPADYLPPMQEDPELVDFCEISPELSRPFRGLRAWLPLRLHGVGPFRDALQEKLELSDWIHDRLRAIADLEIIAAPQLSVTAWRWVPAGVDVDRLDELNRELLRRINARQRVYLTGTRLGGRFAIRVCVLSFRTHMERMEACAEDIVLALASMREELT
jgi:aromatic-L-amino-acid decarboxylase